MKPLPGFLLLLPLLALAACGGGREAPPESPQLAACRAQADQSPAVRALIARQAGSQFQIQGQRDLEAARRDAVEACLRRKGVLPPGGVERVKQPDSLFNGLF